MPMPSRELALRAADRHRAEYGDDVITHDADDYGNFFACPDCSWALAYPDDDFDDPE